MNIPEPGTIVHAAWLGSSWVLVEKHGDGWVTQDGGRGVNAPVCRLVVMSEPGAGHPPWGSRSYLDANEPPL